MAAPIRFLSGRQQQQKIGIEGSTEDEKVLEVVGRVGIGTTIFETTAELDVRGNVVVSGILTVGDIVVSSGVGGVFSIDKLRVSGISTFVGISTFENNLFVGGDLDVYGHIELDNLNVSGVSTFAGAIDANGDLDVDGHTELDDLNVSGVSTFASAIVVGSAVTINSSGINAGTGIITGILDHSLTLQTVGDGLSGVATYNNSGDVTLEISIDSETLNVANAVVRRDSSGDFAAGTISADLTGVASTATKLETSRNFDISGGFVTAPSVSFDGTGNVSLAATITTNSIALGTYTTGDYVSEVSGTNNEIAVSGGTGEGSSATISFVTNPTIGGNVTIGNDLQVNNNLNVTGNITVGGTSATLFTETLRVKDSDIVLGFTTNSSGIEVSTDTTANNGGIAIASTEGSPIVSFNVDSIPSTYKNIMWFKTNAFTGLNTDAWLTNYSFGVGTTSMSAGTKFAVGNIEADFDDITSVRHINSSGVVTATTFSGDGSELTGVSGGTSLDENETTNQSQFIPFYVSTATTDISGVSTQSFVFNPSTKSLGIGTGVPTSNLHVEGTSNISGVSTFGNNIDANGNIDVNGKLDVDGHTELDNLNVSGVSTFASAVDINADLDVDGHTELDNVNVSGVSTFSDDVRFVGAANTDVVWDKSANSLNFEDYAKATFGDGGDLTITHGSNQSSISESGGNGLEVKSVKVTITPNGSTEKMAEFNANSSVELYFDDSKKLETTGYGITVTGDVNTSNNISIAGVSTFAGAIDANGSLDVDGLTELDDVNVSGASIFTGDIDANGDLDVDGHTELDDLNVSGVSTFASEIVVSSAVTINSSGINAPTGIITTSSLDSAISEWVLGADGVNNYTFSGPGFIGAENDPELYVVRGQKYNFENKMGAHPFRIQSTPNGSTGTQYNDGITNNDVSNGTLVWNVQFDAPQTLYYQCTSHPDMGGKIYVGSSSDSITSNNIVVGSATTITGSGINVPTGIITASTFSGSGASLTNIPSGALTNNSVNYGGVTVSLGGTDATPAFDLSDATNYPYTSLTGITTEILGDTTPQLGGNLDLNSKFITGTGGVNVTGVVTATTFSGSGASLTNIPSGALTNNSVNYGGVTVSLGGTDATPAFDLSDATAYPYTSLTGITTEIVGDTTPQLGGNLDLNSKFITGTGGVNVTGVVTATSTVINSAVVGSGVTVNSSGINVTGVVTATSFSGDGANLINLPAPESAGDKYNTGITTSIYVSITGGIGTAQAGLNTVAANNDIFIGPGIAYSFPSTAGKSYVIESIHVTNIYNTQLYFTSRHDFNGGENVPTAQRVIVPYQGALEVLKEPIVAKPSDILRFQAFTGVGITATGVDNGLDSFIIYSEKTDTDFIGTGKTVVTPAGTELFTSNTNPSVIQSIQLCNYDLDFDVDASVSIYRGGSVGGILTTGVRQGYLVYNLTVPKNSVIEILERPKYLAANDTVVVGIAGTTLTNSLSSTLSGKYIV